MKAVLTLSALILSAPSCLALTFAGATENLLYFEYADLGSKHCEKQGMPDRPTFLAWQARHEPLFRQTLQTVRAEGKKRGLATPDEQDAFLFAVMGMAGKSAQALIDRRNGVPCDKFGRFIDGVASDFKR